MRLLILAFSFVLLISITAHSSYQQHQLEWPTKIKDGPHKFGPTLHQFQKFEDSYFHEGFDIITPIGQNIFSPVSGYVDAGYYSYTSLPSGLGEKKYISIKDIDPEDNEPKLWGDQYFEVSITDEFGNRFELHHIDRYSMSKELLKAIKEHTKISSRTFIGHVVEWPVQNRGVDYDHIHYSIMDSKNVSQNPIWLSKRIKDETPPIVESKYALLNKRCSFNGQAQFKELSQLNDSDVVTHIVLRTKDYLGENSFPNPPTKLTAQFDDKTTFKFDYSKSLFENSLNSFLLRDLYASGKFCIGSLEFPLVIDSSSTFDFYIKIPVPKKYKGSVKIKLSDFNNNSTQIDIDL